MANEQIPWKPYSKRLIQQILVLPIGSADIERGFSVLKHIKYDRRSSLGLPALNALLRVRLNGPEIEKFNALTMAKLWKRTGHILTDSKEQIIPRKRMTDKEKQMEESITFVEEYYNEGKVFSEKSKIFYNI